MIVGTCLSSIILTHLQPILAENSPVNFHYIAVLLQCYALRACSQLCRYGIRGLVIDPYNELDHQRPVHMNETEYVSQMLTKIKRFAQHNDVHVWFVAHPRQLQGWKGEPPNLYDISGSAHFINKADNGIVIHRNRDPEQGALNHVRYILLELLCNHLFVGFGICLECPLSKGNLIWEELFNE